MPSYKKEGENVYSEIPESAWASETLDVKCVKETFKNLKPCKDTSDCPVGGYCKKDDTIAQNVGAYCEFFGACENDSDCNPTGNNVEGDVERNMRCDTDLNLCVLDVSLSDGDCSCPFGFGASFNGCLSPFCVDPLNTLGTCKVVGAVQAQGSDKWVGGSYSCGERLEEPANTCKSHTDCWDNGLQACCTVNNETKGSGIAGGYVEGKCSVDDVYQCFNDYAGVKKCPPGFNFSYAATDENGNYTKEPSCVSSCKLSYEARCKVDTDCEWKKETLFTCSDGRSLDIVGECIDLDDPFFGFDKETISDCYKSGISKQCSFSQEEKDTIAKVKANIEAYKKEFCDESYVGISFSIPSTDQLNQLGESDPAKIIGNLIKTALGVIGSIALAMFVYGGLLWMTAMGKGEQQKKAMNVILWSSLGVFVILSSYIIVSFVLQVFGI